MMTGPTSARVPGSSGPDEGITSRWLSTIGHVDTDGLTIEAMELDADGYPQPTGRTEHLAADSVVLALGQDTDLSLMGDTHHLDVHNGVVLTDPVTGRRRSSCRAAGCAWRSAPPARC